MIWTKTINFTLPEDSFIRAIPLESNIERQLLSALAVTILPLQVRLIYLFHSLTKKISLYLKLCLVKIFGLLFGDHHLALITNGRDHQRMDTQVIQRTVHPRTRLAEKLLTQTGGTERSQFPARSTMARAGLTMGLTGNVRSVTPTLKSPDVD